MGTSSWSDDFYRDRQAYRSRTGQDAFAYDADVRTGRVESRVHEKMDPKGVIRESRDSDLHPESVAIAVMFDITGSMGRVPRILQKKLPKLNGLLTREGYVKHPHVMFGGIGDSTSDQAPLQVGQFEAGIEMDDDLSRMWLEGCGGGQKRESYQNTLYFFARHTSIDCYEKRQKKGYLFIIGDELPYDTVSRTEIKNLIGDTLEADITTEAIVREAQEKYEVFFIIPSGTSYYNNREIEDRWVRLVGSDRVLKLENPELACETIGMAIALNEGASLEQAQESLQKEEVSEAAIRTVTATLAPFTGQGFEEARNMRL